MSDTPRPGSPTEQESREVAEAELEVEGQLLDDVEPAAEQDDAVGLHFRRVVLLAVLFPVFLLDLAFNENAFAFGDLGSAFGKILRIDPAYPLEPAKIDEDLGAGCIRHGARAAAQNW